MSSAFMKEEAGERWTPPPTPQEYRVLLDGAVVYESGDLLSALHWLASRPGSGFEVRSRENILLAQDF